MAEMNYRVSIEDLFEQCGIHETSNSLGEAVYYAVKYGRTVTLQSFMMQMIAYYMIEECIRPESREVLAKALDELGPAPVNAREIVDMALEGI